MRVKPIFWIACILGAVCSTGNAQVFSGNNAPGDTSTFNFTMNGATNLSLSLPGTASGYSHLLLKKGSAPTDSSFDFISQLSSQTNTIHIEEPEFVPATYYATVRTPAGAPAHSFTLTVESNRTDLRTVLPVSKALAFTNSGSIAAGGWNYFRVEVPTNSTALKITLESTNNSPDLYLQRGQTPTTASFLKRSSNQVHDVVLLADTEATAGAYFIGVFAPAAGGAANYTLKTEVLNLLTLNFDDGSTHNGTETYTGQTTGTNEHYFKIRTGSPAVGAWRTALNVISGEAHVYLSRGTLPSTNTVDYKSERAGSDGMVLGSLQFSAGEDWYIMVRSAGAAEWSLVSGAAYVMDLGALASDASSSTNVTVGPEGWRFFKTSIPANTLAWRLWLSDTNGMMSTNNLYLRKSSVPLLTANELNASGQMLVVPPYLAVGQLYFIGVPGIPGASVNLDSRQQAVSDLPFTSSTVVNFTGYGYTTYRVQVPPNEIAWQISLTPTAGDPDLYVRRNLVPNENNNDAYSEVSKLVADSISLVPPTLSDGTFYITVGATNTNSFTLQSGPPTITDINYTATVTNDETNRAGWRYFRVGSIEQQLGSLGWDLLLTNAAPGTRIALRRSRAPSILTYRNPSQSVLNSFDFYSTSDFLQRPAHQADIWYIGIYSPTNALGDFTLITRDLNAPILTETEAGGGNGGGGGETNLCLLSGTIRTNVDGFKWEFFRVDVPNDVDGWDVRVVNVASGMPRIAVRLGGLPTNEYSGGIVTTNLRTTISSPGTATNWPNGQQWAATVDWTKRQFSAEGLDENGRIIALGSGRPLLPGATYYVGVFNASSNAATYEVVNRFVGAGKRIPMTSLDFTGGTVTNSVCPREAAYYRVNIPPNTPSWKVRLTMLAGEAMLVASTNKVPNTESEKRVQKLGKEHYLLLPRPGQSYLTPGDHYLAVVGEGVDPTTNNRIGTAQSTYVIESIGTLPIINLGTLVDELWHTNEIDGGESVAYQFQGMTGTLGFEVYIEPEYGNPTMVIRSGTSLPDPGYPDGFPVDPYGNEGGDPGTVSTFKIFSSGIAPIETLVVKARALAGLHPDARYVLRIRRYTAEPLTFDGGSALVENQEDFTFKYFEVDVPPTALGWDVRVTNVTAGVPDLVVCREAIPPSTDTSQGFNPSTATTWPLFARWGADSDWTGRPESPDGEFENWRILAMGMGHPLEPGKYYVGVFSFGPTSYTLMSRGIATNMAINVPELAYTGGSSSGSLPAREAAYFKVTIPTNAPSWQVRLTTASPADEVALIALRGAIPSVLASGNFSATNATSCGRKMQKAGAEQWVLLPPPGTTSLLPGDYYLAVVSEGSGSTDRDQVGAGLSTFTVTSVGALPFVDLGTLEIGTDIIQPGQADAGETVAFKFNVLENTSSLEARLENRTGNPVMVTRPEPRLPDPGMTVPGGSADTYGSEGGDVIGTLASAQLVTVANPTPGMHYLLVKARQTNSIHTNATFTLRLKANNTTEVAFDAGSTTVTNQTAGTWRYFRVDVPTNALGWDVRLTDVQAGLPKMVIRRDVLPASLQNSSWTPGNTFSWPSSNQWVAASDWTKRQYSPDGLIDQNGRIIAMGLGRPLEPGVYYIGVINSVGTNKMAYTLLSRGIGDGMSIPIVDVPYNGGSATNTALLAREAAYFRVVVPSNSPSWKVKVSGTAGEFMAVGLRNRVPNVDYIDPSRTIGDGRSLQKSGNEHFLLLPTAGQTNVVAGTNYFAVASEGANPTSNTRIGSGSSTFTFTSVGALPVVDLGVISSTDLEMADTLEGGESKAYQFTVPVGIVGVEVKLEDRVGNPILTLRPGSALPNPGGAFGSISSENYGNEGGYTPTDAHPVLLTLPNPTPGTYSLMIKARAVNNVFSDASYRIRIREVLTPQLNFGSYQNTNGLSNSVSGLLEDNQRAFFMVNVPPTVNGSPLGWKLELRQSSGLASVRVRKDALPSDSPATGTPFASPAAYIVPPYLTNGTWFVEVKGSNFTSFTLTSSPIEIERPAWVMPGAGETNTAPGLALPLFGDSGIDTNGLALDGDQSLYLEQGYQHYYSVYVPSNNAGLFRVQLEAISGNPDLYARMSFVPTISHSVSGSSGSVSERTMVATGGTEYANWVPLDGKVDSSLKSGHYYLMVRAAGNANARYRLRVSTGNIDDINLLGDSRSNQVLANGDWRYYRFQVPSPVPLNWHLTFSQEAGSVAMYVRDTVPPGLGNHSTDYKHWTTSGDQKNNGPYTTFGGPGTYSIGTPPTRPGHTYYVGFRAVSDAVFSLNIGTNGAPVAEAPDIPFYGGTITTSIPGLSQVTYRIDVPPDATRWKHFSTHTTNLLLFIEQGTLPLKTTTDDWRSNGNTNTAGNQYLLNPLPGAWPWIPAQTYFLTVSNRAGSSESLTFTMDGRNAVTDDEDNDGMPDAWERQYFNNSTGQSANADFDNDGVSNLLEYQEGTSPTDNTSFRPRLTTSSVNGTINRDPNLASYTMDSVVTLTPVPNAGYAFVVWSNAVSSADNPLALLMNSHKNISAIFKVIGDDFSIAVPVSGSSVNASGTNIGATKEPGEPNHGGNPGGKSIWWKWVAPSSGNVIVDTAGSSFNTVLGVYTGSSVAGLTTIGSNVTSGTNKARVTFSASSGTTYYLAVDGISAASGTVNLSILAESSTAVLQMLSPQRTGNVFQFVLQGAPNQVYTIDVSSNLVNWNPLMSVTNSGSGTLPVSDSSGESPRFYRFRVP